jgi:hypothetical protein
VESLRSVFFKNINDRIPYFDIRYSLFDIRYSLFQSFFFDLAGHSFADCGAEPRTQRVGAKPKAKTQTRNPEPSRMKLRQIGTANRRISNKKFRMMNCGIAALSLFKK